MRQFINFIVRLVLGIPALAQAMGIVLLFAAALENSKISTVCSTLGILCFFVLLRYLSTYENLVQETIEMLIGTKDDK